jgi:hypothetical protein
MLDANLIYMVIFLLYKMLAAAKYIGAGVACSGLIGAGAGIDSLTLILNILGFTIILITLGTIVLKGGKGFIEGIKALANVATIIAAGAGVGAGGVRLEIVEMIERTEKKQAEEAEEAQQKQNAQKS